MPKMAKSREMGFVIDGAYNNNERRRREVQYNQVGQQYNQSPSVYVPSDEESSSFALVLSDVPQRPTALPRRAHGDNLIDFGTPPTHEHRHQTFPRTNQCIPI